MFSHCPKSHGISKRLAKALIRLRVCAGWSEPLLIAHTSCWKSHVTAKIVLFDQIYDTPFSLYCPLPKLLIMISFCLIKVPPRLSIYMNDSGRSCLSCVCLLLGKWILDNSSDKGFVEFAQVVGDIRRSVLEVIKLEYSLKLKIKRNGWLFADTCPQAANHCALF